MRRKCEWKNGQQIKYYNFVDYICVSIFGQIYFSLLRNCV